MWLPHVKLQPVVTQHPSFNSSSLFYGSLSGFTLLNKVSVHWKHCMEMWNVPKSQRPCGGEWHWADTGLHSQPDALSSVMCSSSSGVSISGHLAHCSSFIKPRWMLLQNIRFLWDYSAEDGILGASWSVYPLRWFTASPNDSSSPAQHSQHEKSWEKQCITSVQRKNNIFICFRPQRCEVADVFN